MPRRSRRFWHFHSDDKTGTEQESSTNSLPSRLENGASQSNSGILLGNNQVVQAGCPNAIISEVPRTTCAMRLEELEVKLKREAKESSHLHTRNQDSTSGSGKLEQNNQRKHSNTLEVIDDEEMVENDANNEPEKVIIPSRSEAEELQEQLKEVNRKLEERSNELDELRKSHIFALEEKTRAQRALEEQDITLEHLEKKVERKSTESMKQQKSLDEVIQKVHVLNKSLQHSEWKCGEFMATVKDKDDEIENLKRALEKANYEKEEMAAELDVQQQKCVEHMAQLETLISLGDPETRAKELEQENTRLKDQLNSYHYNNATRETFKQNHSRGDYEELSSELFKTHQRKYSLELKLSETETELRSYQTAHAKMNKQQQMMEEELLQAAETESKLRWRIGELEADNRELNEKAILLESNQSKDVDSTTPEQCKEQLPSSSFLEAELNEAKTKLNDHQEKVIWYQAEVDYFRRELSSRDGKIAWLQRELEEAQGLLNKMKNASPVDCSEAERQHLNHEINVLRSLLKEEEDKRRWYEGEKDYFKREFETCSKKCKELQFFRDRFSNELTDSFLVNKEPYYDRDRWLLCKWNTIIQRQAKRVLFEICEPTAHSVLLCLSSFNWECALLMRKRDDGNWYVWVDLPTGRHEFRFIKTTAWFASPNYDHCINDYGDENNWMVVN